MMPSDPTFAEKFNTCRSTLADWFADCKEKVVNLLKRARMVNVGTQKIVKGMTSTER